jgi:serine/threonine protein kinase
MGDHLAGGPTRYSRTLTSLVGKNTHVANAGTLSSATSTSLGLRGRGRSITRQAHARQSLIRSSAVKFCPQCSGFYANDATYCADDGSELKRTLDPYLGRTIAARYRLVRRLGSGGMSSVYLAHHVMIERLSALKILREDLSRHATHRERFLREARAVNRINHPNIVEISDLGEADGVAYLVMEFVDGPSLHQEIARGIFAWQRAVRIGLQIAAALARAHQMGVVHRDLKPENILLPKRREDDGLTLLGPQLPVDHERVKLTDFGIAKILDEPGVTVGEQLFGTPGYIAPEYLEGHDADPRADLYSLGVLLYEMTTGVLPYDDRGAALLTAPMRSPPVPPSERVPAYFHDLEKLILHLLARDPAERPPDAFAVYDALIYLLRAEVDQGPPVLSTSPAATRITFGAQVGVREHAKTMFEVPFPTEASGTHPRQTSDLTAAAAAGTVRWHEALAKLETAMTVAQRQKLPRARIERAAELVGIARGKVLTLERVARAVGTQQDRVDALESEGRRFRDDFGRAIDQLVRDRSHERARSRSGGRPLSISGNVRDPGGHADIALWETALLAADGGTKGISGEDLTFQIDALQRSLQAKNVALEADIVEASGALEGSLAAIRHLTHELRRLVDEAGEELREVEEQVTASSPAANGASAGPPTAQPTGQRSWRP